MVSFWKVVNDVIFEADVIIEVLDARFPEETRNREIEQKLLRLHKKIIYVLNKSDLLTIKFSDLKHDFDPFVYVSAKNNLGTTKLRGFLKEYLREKQWGFKRVKVMLKTPPKEMPPLIVGVVGYPNTGKSSLINALKQRRSASTSSTPGFTRGIQKIRIAKEIYLIDTPGVFAYKEGRKASEEKKITLINVKDYRKVKDPEYVAIEILDRCYKSKPQIIEETYGVKPMEDPEQTLELIARKFNWLIKGGKPNLDQTARKIIQDWQRGKIII